jgi:hypothetical protein
MLLLQLLYIAGLASGFGQNIHDNSLGGAEFCETPPMWAYSFACRSDEQVRTVESPKTHIGMALSPQEWQGPSQCVGKYCVFSNRRFSGGMVAVTTKENAERMGQLPNLQPDKNTPQEPSYYVTSVPGKGMGFVANRTIRRGDRIMAKMPTLLVNRKFMEDTTSREETFRILDAAVMKLPAERRRAFMRQLGHFGGHKVSDILFTNSFQMDIGGEDGHHFGNFPEISRFNHDCRPK